MMRIKQNINKTSDQSIRLKYRSELMLDWERLTHWSNTGEKLYNRPVSTLINRLLSYAHEDYKKCKKVKEVMRFRYQIADGVYCCQSYGISNLSQVVLYPPKHRVDLKPICSGYGLV